MKYVDQMLSAYVYIAMNMLNHNALKEHFYALFYGQGFISDYSNVPVKRSISYHGCIANVQNVLYNFWKEFVLWRSFPYYFQRTLANITFIICPFSQILVIIIKSTTGFIFLCNVVFLVGCTRILVGIWSAHDIVFELFQTCYYYYITRSFPRFLRSLFLLKRTRSSTFFIHNYHVRFIYILYDL